MTAASIASVVAAAAAGEAEAWDRLVDQYSRLVWAVARDHGLSASDAADVSQTTWLRLAEHLHRLRDPERIGLWLATTARNECLRTLRRAQRDIPTDPASCTTAEVDTDIDVHLLEEERDAALWKAFETLSPPCKVLLRTLMSDPAPSYAEVSARLGMPVGSIGPTRNRCLERLRRRAEHAQPRPEGVRASTARRAVS